MLYFMRISLSATAIKISVTVLFAAISFLLFSQIALHRFIAADEGFYLLAGKLVANGMLPYSDFFYPQMPLLPYFHATWISLLGESWITSRIIAASMASSIAAILFLFLWRVRSLSIALLAGALFITAPEILYWFTVSKTYVFSGAPLIASCALLYYSLYHADKHLIPRLVLISGFLLGIAIGVRLFYFAFIPVYFIYVFFHVSNANRLKALKALTFGLVLSALPHMLFLLHDITSYWFNNLGYHLSRNHRPHEIAMELKVKVARWALGLDSTNTFGSPCLPFLFWLNCVIALVGVCKGKLLPLPTSLGLVLFACYLTPTPIHLQYFSTCMPFFILGVATASWKRWVATSLLSLLTATTLIMLPQTFERLTVSGQGVKGIDQKNRQTFTLSTVTEVSEFLNQQFAPGSRIISQWPGFLFETSLLPVSGLENQFWIRMDEKLSPQQVDQFKLMTRPKMRLLPQDSSVDGLIIETHKFDKYFSEDIIEESKLSEITAPDGFRVFKSQDAP